MIESMYIKSETVPAFDEAVSAIIASYGIEGGGKAMNIAVENFGGKIYRVVTSVGMGAYMHATSSLLGLGLKDILANSIHGKDGYDSWFVTTPEMLDTSSSEAAIADDPASEILRTNSAGVELFFNEDSVVENKSTPVNFESSRKAVHGKEASYRAKLPAMRDWLIEVARHKDKVEYGQVMEVFGIDRFSLRHAMDFLGHQADNLNEPIITALIIGKKSRQCSSGLAKEFGVHDDGAERQRLYDFWGGNHNEHTPVDEVLTDLDVKAARFVSVEARPDQAAFRRRVYLACNGRCVISGCDVLKALDAAHKHGRDWRLGHNSAEDGYLLRKDLHALYDNKLLGITDEGQVELDLGVMEHYEQYAGVSIFINQK